MNGEEECFVILLTYSLVYTFTGSYFLFSVGVGVALAPSITTRSAERHELKEWSDREGALIWMTHRFLGSHDDNCVPTLPFYHVKPFV